MELVKQKIEKRAQRLNQITRQRSLSIVKSESPTLTIRPQSVSTPKESQMKTAPSSDSINQEEIDGLLDGLLDVHNRLTVVEEKQKAQDDRLNRLESITAELLTDGQSKTADLDEIKKNIGKTQKEVESTKKTIGKNDKSLGNVAVVLEQVGQIAEQIAEITSRLSKVEVITKKL